MNRSTSILCITLLFWGGIAQEACEADGQVESISLDTHMIQASFATTPQFDPDADAILVYSKGKTGTTTLQTSLGRLLRPPCSVSGDVSQAVRGLKTHYQPWAQQFLERRPQGSRTWVITSFRNSFTRYPSAFFQEYLGDHGSCDVKDFDNVSVEQLLREFHVWLPREPDMWWRSHYGFLGMNMTDVAAALVGRHQALLHVSNLTWNGRHLEIIFLMLEKAFLWEKALRSLFPGLDLTKANTADQKPWYESKYKDFMKQLIYSDDEMHTIGQEDVMQYLYAGDAEAMNQGRANDIADEFACTETPEAIEDAC